MAKGKPIVGIDLGGTNMQIGVVDAAGNIIGRSRAKTLAQQGAAKVLNRIFEGIEAACGHAGIPATSLGGIGIGAPGAIDAKTGMVVEAVNLRWSRVPLAKLLRERFGCPVLVDNDVNVAVFGEWRMGAGRGVDDLLGIWVGTGIGGGLILGGRMFQGPHFSAGEIGHTTLIPGAPFGRRSLEQTCARTAVAERLVSLIRQNHPSSLAGLVKDGDPPKSRAIADAYKSGDKLTRRVVDEAGEYLGIAAANMCTVLSISRVILGGGLTEAIGAPLVARVQETVVANVFPTSLRKSIKVSASRLEDDAGLVGAALMARDAIEFGETCPAWEHVADQMGSRRPRGKASKAGKQRRRG